MNETTVVLLSVGLGLMLGWVRGDEVRRRKNAEAKVEDLHLPLEQTASQVPTPERQLREIRKVLNDTHKQITAVSKALKNPAPQTTKKQRPDPPDPAVPKGVGW